MLLDEFVGEADTRRDGTDIGSNTSRTGANTGNLLLEIASLKHKPTTLERRLISLKISWENIANGDKKDRFFILGFATLKVC